MKIGAECWFCNRPVVTGERAHRSLDGGLTVHAECLRHDALHDSDRAADLRERAAS